MMSIMSVKIVKKPQNKYMCRRCLKPLKGIHFCAYHGGDSYGKPFIVRLCIPCASEDVIYSCYKELKKVIDIEVEPITDEPRVMDDSKDKE